MSNGVPFIPPAAPGRSQQYAQDHLQNETYPTYDKDADGHEVYQKIDPKHIYAIDSKKVPFYAKKNNKSEYYATDDHQNELYIKIKGEEIYTKDSDGDEEYAKKADGSEFYAKSKHGKPKFAKFLGREIYAKNAKKEEIYPRNAQGKCIVAKNEFNQPYYIKVNGKEVYPTDTNNNQFVWGGNYIIGDDGKEILPTDSSGLPIYEKDADGDEMYRLDSQGDPIFGKNKNGEEFYAKTKNLDEHYPVINGFPVFAKVRQKYKYALDKHGMIIYPIINNEQFYISKGLFMLSDHFTDYIPGKYPKNSFDDEILINDEYAKDLSGKLFYPKDSFHNEFTRHKMPVCIDDEYPVTNDGYIIVPNIENEPVYCNDQVSEENIIGLLYRNHSTYDFLTNFQTNKKCTKQVKYKKIPLVVNENVTPIYLNRTVQYIVGALVFIIFILLLLI